MFCYLSIPVSRLYLAERALRRLLTHLPIDLFPFLLPSIIVFITWVLCMGGLCKNDLYRQCDVLIV